MTSQTLTSSTSRFQPVLLIPIVLAVLVFIAYQFLPFVNQPDLGATTISTLVLRLAANNELGVNTNGLALIPFAALVLLGLGVWNLTNAQVSRATAVLTALAGVLVLEYFAVFALDYRAEAATYLGQMGVGFWALLGLGVVMLAQVAVPRPEAPREYSLRSLAANQESAIIIALVVLLVGVGLNSPRFFGDAQPARRAFGQRLHRGGGHRHEYAHHYRQHRHFGGFAHRLAGGRQRAARRGRCARLDCLARTSGHRRTGRCAHRLYRDLLARPVHRGGRWACSVS